MCIHWHLTLHYLKYFHLQLWTFCCCCCSIGQPWMLYCYINRNWSSEFGERTIELINIMARRAQFIWILFSCLSTASCQKQIAVQRHRITAGIPHCFILIEPEQRSVTCAQKFHKNSSFSWHSPWWVREQVTHLTKRLLLWQSDLFSVNKRGWPVSYKVKRPLLLLWLQDLEKAGN